MNVEHSTNLGIYPPKHSMLFDAEKNESESGILLDDVDMQEPQSPHYYDKSPTSSTQAYPPEGLSPSGKRISRHRERKRKAKMIEWMRWSAVILLQVVIIGLLLWHRGEGWTPEKTETGGDINGIYIPRMCFFPGRGWKNVNVTCRFPSIHTSAARAGEIYA
jgi:hypothetical protein